MATVKGQFQLEWRDYDGERSKVSLTTAVITAVNFDAQAVLRANLITALGNVLLGQLQQHEIANATDNAVSAPNEPTAQRELAWLIKGNDPTAVKPFKNQLSCPKLSLLDPNDRANAEIGDADLVDAFVTAYEGFVLSEAGNAVVVDEITLVGRNL